MIERVIGKFKPPWSVIHHIDFLSTVVDADYHVICETDDADVAEAIAELPNMYYRLKAIAQSEPAIICHIGGEDVGCPRCDSLIRGGKEMMHRLGVNYDKET